MARGRSGRARATRGGNTTEPATTRSGSGAGGRGRAQVPPTVHVELLPAAETPSDNPGDVVPTDPTNCVQVPQVVIEEVFDLNVSGSEDEGVSEPQQAVPRRATTRRNNMDEPELPSPATDPINRTGSRSTSSTTEDVRHFFSRVKGEDQYCRPCK